jgi:hypothetical protein
MKPRALFCLSILLLGLGSGCAVDSSASPELGPAWPADVQAADAAPPAAALTGRAAGGLEPAPPAAVHVPTPGAIYRVGDAVRSGDLVVALLDGRAAAPLVEARFLIQNVGPAEAVVSPGNFRLRLDGGRPRMRLREPPAPLPVGRLRPGDTLHGAVTWEVADPAGARVVFANGAATVEWALAS